MQGGLCAEQVQGWASWDQFHPRATYGLGRAWGGVPGSWNSRDQQVVKTFPPNQEGGMGRF